MSKPTSAVEGFTLGLRRSPLLRLAALGFLVLLLLIPIEWISELITERMARRDEAVADVSGKWGRQQTIVGPALVIPYTYRWTVRASDGTQETKTEAWHITVLPSDLRLRARLQVEERSRGIFVVPVYRVVLNVEGEFDPPDLAELGVDPEPSTVDWARSVLSLGISDARAIQNRASLTWNGETHEFLPGPATFNIRSGIHAGVERPFAVARPSFAFELTFNGSSRLSFTPSGEQTSVVVDSNWPSPSFQGSWLPAERTLAPDGFRASWEIPFLGRNQASAWTTPSSDMVEKLENISFGVALVTPVDAHRMADRSVKYARLFVLMTFGLIWLIEVLSRVRVHPVQYLLIGCALCTFYLLELSLSEQFGFAVAYAIAAAAVAGLVGLYAAFVLRGRMRAAVVTATVAGLYGYLYVLLTNEDYALLLGSIGVFTAVAAAMLLTRRIDWYAVAGRAGAPVSPAPPEGQGA